MENRDQKVKDGNDKKGKTDSARNKRYPSKAHP
jgi:hypothetical protein